MRFIFFCFPLVFNLMLSEPKLNGNWKMVSSEAVDKIKSLPAYLYASDNEREMMNRQFNLILDNCYYYFKQDTLIYTDIEYGELTSRRALYERKKDTLLIKEIDRTYTRWALINKCSKDSLSLTPIIDGKVGASSILFIREN